MLKTPLLSFSFSLFLFRSLSLSPVSAAQSTNIMLDCLCIPYNLRTKGEGWSTTNSFKPPSNFIAGRPRAALLFWFFGGFRCGVPLFFVMLVIY